MKRYQQMKMAYFHNGSVIIREKEIPHPSAGEVLIKVTMAAICNTDIELSRGYYDFSGVPGHEFVGIVIKSPDNRMLEGKRVVADINCGCGDCAMCREGKHQHCMNRRTIGIKDWNGAFAEYVLAPLQNLYEVPDKLPDEEAVFTEPLAAALEPTQQIHITNQQKVLVMGDGKLGLLTALAWKHYNPGLHLLGKHSDKLAIAEQAGIKTILRDLFEHDRQECYDIVVEATGTAEGINEAIDYTKAEGTIIAKTTSHLPSSVDLSKIVVKEICILGSRCGDMDLALSFLQEGYVNVKPLIEADYPLEEFEKAFEHAIRPGSKKVLIRM